MKKESLDEVFASIRSGLARSVSGIVPPKEIEDIVQETYVRACQAIQLSEIRAPRSFLYKTARNLALDQVKRAEVRLVVGSAEESIDSYAGQRPFADEAFEHVASDEEFSFFCDAVRHLPTQIRRAFVLKKVYGYSQREIAQEMGLAESTVEKHIAQGIKRCRASMMERTQKREGDRSAAHVTRSAAQSRGKEGNR